MEFTKMFNYTVPTGRVVSKLKKAGLVPTDISLNYVGSIPNVLLRRKNSFILFQPSNLHDAGGIKIVIQDEKFEDSAREMGNLLREAGLPLYADRESLVYPLNHLGMNVLGDPKVHFPDTQELDVHSLPL